MIDEKVETKMRSVKARAKEDSELLTKMVDSMVAHYARDLDQYVEKMQALLKDARDRNSEVPVETLEQAVLNIPVMIYFSATGLEHLGIEGDSAAAIKKEVFALNYIKAEGTIQDKNSSADLDTMSETYVEVAFQRAYKMLKAKVEKAEHIFSGFKKVLTKRMMEYDVNQRDNGQSHTRPRRAFDDD